MAASKLGRFPIRFSQNDEAAILAAAKAGIEDSIKAQLELLRARLPLLTIDQAKAGDSQ